MYALQEVLRVANSRQSEAIKRLNWIHSLIKGQPGFIRAQVSRFLGNPTDYLILRMWETAGDWAGFRETPDGQNYPKSRPEGLYEGLAAGRDWELVIDSQGAGPGNYLVRGTYKVGADRLHEFVENRRRHDKLALEVAGTVYLQTLRCTDDEPDNKDTFMVLGRRTDRDAYNAYLESRQAAEYRQGNVRGLYRTLGTECYEVVDEVTP